MSDPINISTQLGSRLENQFKYPVQVYADSNTTEVVIYISEGNHPTLTYSTADLVITDEFVIELKQKINQIIDEPPAAPIQG